MDAVAPPICPQFVESWFNEVAGRRHRVLGRRLRPFCAWHQFLLQAIGSPLLIPDASPTLADVQTAVRICRSRYRTPLSRILPGPPSGQVGRWCSRVGTAWTAARYPLPPSLAAFGRYVGDYMAPPEFWEAKATGAVEVQNHFPSPLPLVASLLAGAVFAPDNEAAIWEMPLGQAHWYSAAFAKQNGADVRLRTESDELLERARREKAEYAARKKRKQRKAKP